MKYGILSIDLGSCNLGNRLIEYAVFSTLGLPKPAVRVSMFKAPTKQQVDQLNKCDFVLLPGSTILAKAKGNSEALVCLSKIKVPKICVAASGWRPQYPYYEDAMKHITPPIGCRDLGTVAVCEKLGIPNVFIGCPTAYMPKREYGNISGTVIGFGRNNVAAQKALFRKANDIKLALVQEKNFGVPVAKSLGINYLLYERSKQIYDVYAKCKNVLTGRLHGVLPAMSQGKNVMFFGNAADSRFSLLSYLGIRIVNLKHNTDLAFQTSAEYSKKLQELKEAYQHWGQLVGLL